MLHLLCIFDSIFMFLRRYVLILAFVSKLSQVSQVRVRTKASHGSSHELDKLWFSPRQVISFGLLFLWFSVWSLGKFLLLNRSTWMQIIFKREANSILRFFHIFSCTLLVGKKVSTNGYYWVRLFPLLDWMKYVLNWTTKTTFSGICLCIKEMCLSTGISHAKRKCHYMNVPHNFSFVQSRCRECNSFLVCDIFDIFRSPYDVLTIWCSMFYFYHYVEVLCEGNW